MEMYNTSTCVPEGSQYVDTSTCVPEGSQYVDTSTCVPEGSQYVDTSTCVPEGSPLSTCMYSGDVQHKHMCTRGFSILLAQ